MKTILQFTTLLLAAFFMHPILAENIQQLPSVDSAQQGTREGEKVKDSTGNAKKEKKLQPRKDLIKELVDTVKTQSRKSL